MIPCWEGENRSLRPLPTPNSHPNDSRTLGHIGAELKALNATGLVLAVTGGAVAIGGAVLWVVKARTSEAQQR